MRAADLPVIALLDASAKRFEGQLLHLGGGGRGQRGQGQDSGAARPGNEQPIRQRTPVPDERLANRRRLGVRTRT
jgi:hypothetical protein